MIREGKVRALGVSTAVRSPSAPEIPPIAEAGVPGFDAAGWGMIAVPAGTPKPIVSRLHTALNSVARIARRSAADHQARHDPRRPLSPEELQRFIESEIARWGKVVQQAGLAGSEVAPLVTLGSTRGSISFAGSEGFAKGWIAGSSPAMTWRGI